jgi:hypothetical protein
MSLFNVERFKTKTVDIVRVPISGRLALINEKLGLSTLSMLNRQITFSSPMRLITVFSCCLLHSRSDSCEMAFSSCSHCNLNFQLNVVTCCCCFAEISSKSPQ